MAQGCVSSDHSGRDFTILGEEGSALQPRRTKELSLLALESRIKRELRVHMRTLGFIRSANGELRPPDDSKESLRSLHRLQREERLAQEGRFIEREWPELRNHFADGKEVNPARISPRLELVLAETWQSRLFRLASLTWSVPVSQGYGRRMRFLLWDDNNDRLIGIIALGDPVFNLSVRDGLIGWTAEQRRERLVNVLDAYVLGALPPYSFLLAGKLVACLLKTKEVRDAFSQRYSKAKGVISNKRKHASLALITTSSALGRSSVYNRLSLGGTNYFRSIGYTAGWGHFHIPKDVFELIRNYLEIKGDTYAFNNRFGDGPNWRMRAIRQALSSTGLNPDLLRHGVSREVFVCEIASNARSFLIGKSKKACYRGLLSANQVSELAKARWIVPRAVRRSEYREWKKDQLGCMLEQPVAFYGKSLAGSAGNEV